MLHELTTAASSQTARGPSPILSAALFSVTGDATATAPLGTARSSESSSHAPQIVTVVASTAASPGIGELSQDCDKNDLAE